MKKTILLTVLMVFGSTLFSGCATMQTWPDNQRSAENKMVLIQEKIGDGLKTGALTPDQSQVFLTTLKGIRTDYDALRNRTVQREEWDSLLGRLDALVNEINRALTRTPRIEEPRNGERIVALQRRIDEVNRRLPRPEGRDFQLRLDSIRRDYLRMTEGGRSTTYEERADISRRLDSLQSDLDRFRPARIEEPRYEDRIVALQRRIDDGRINRRLPLTEEREYQSRLDSIRRDYSRMTEGGRSTTYEERADFSRRLDSLESDLDRYR